MAFSVNAALDFVTERVKVLTLPCANRGGVLSAVQPA